MSNTHKVIANLCADAVRQKNNLADNLNTMGVSASRNELLNTLVPKVLEISKKDDGNVYMDNITLQSCPGEDIIGYVDFGNDAQDIPDDLPIKDGLTHYFDFTKEVKGFPLANAVSDGANLEGTLSSDRTESALTLYGSTYDYGVTNLHNAQTFYVIYKSASSITDWYRNIIGTGVTNSSKQQMVIASRSGYIAVSGYSSDVTSKVSDSTYNVVAVTVDESTGKYSFYINGSLIGEGYGKVGAALGVSCAVYGTDRASVKYINYRADNTYYKMLGIYNTVHTADEVSIMSEYLSKRFLEV